MANPQKGPNGDRYGEVVRRAHEIETQTSLLLASDSEIQEFVRAAEEAGISRDATMQALRERLSYAPEAYSEGELVFAKSGDGAYYVARLNKILGTVADVRFSNGSPGKVPVSDLRPFSLLPGQRVQYDSPMCFTWVTAPVRRINAEGGSATFNLWGTEETVPLEKVRLPGDVNLVPFANAQLWLVGVSSAVGGGLAGALITWLLLR